MPIKGNIPKYINGSVETTIIYRTTLMIGWLKSMNNISLIVQQGVSHEIECGISLEFVF